jgi:hypothetical protein
MISTRHAQVMLITATLALLAGVPVSLPANADKTAPVYADRQNLLFYYDARGELRPVTTPQEWDIRRQHILANMQKVMGPLPKHDPDLPLEIQIVEEVATPKYVRRKITYQSEKGDRVPAYLLIPRQRTGKVPGVVCLHPTNRELGKGVVCGLGGFTASPVCRRIGRTRLRDHRPGLCQHGRVQMRSLPAWLHQRHHERHR